MAGTQLASVLRHIHQLVGSPDRHELSDEQLLQSFLATRDEDAFRLLVQRHGRMVLSVCRHVLRQCQDAEDAFQATFLILARNAASIRKGAALASWLYGVAYRTALKARIQTNRRRLHERKAARMAQAEPELDLALRELQAVLAEEVSRLPEKYRAPFVLCCLEGKTRSEVAQQLGWKEGTVFSRLAEARKRLQQRLARRGLSLAAALCVGTVAESAAAVSFELTHTTIKAALDIVAGQTVTGVVSMPVANLVEGVTQSMFVCKVKLAGILILAAGLVATGIGSRLHRVFATPATENQAAPASARAPDKPRGEKPAAKKDVKSKNNLVVNGRVLDLEGRPLKDVSVHVLRIEAPDESDLTPVLKSIHRDGNRVFHHPMHPEDLKGSPGIVSPVKTDEKGCFRLTGIRKERLVVLRVEGPTIEHKVLYILTRPNLNIKELFQTAAETKMPGMPASSLPAIYGPDFDHTAGPTKPIVGVVRDQVTGKPIADVPINASSSGWWEDYVLTKTDREGRYRLIGLSKSHSYRISAYGAEKDYLPAGMSVGDTEGLAPVTLDFKLVHGVRVKGRITDKTTGKPVPAALWYVPLADNKRFATLPGKDWYRMNSQGHRTEKDGTFSLLALPGSGLIKVRAEVRGENPYTQVALDPADQPRAYETDYDGAMGQSFLSAGGTIETLLGHNAYRLIDPSPDAGIVTCDMQFDHGRTRTGMVVDSDGNPLMGVRASGLSALGGIKTLADNSFQAIALHPDHPRLIAFMHKERKLVGQVLLRADAKEPVKVRLQPGAVLTGRVLDEDGKPLAGITVGPGYLKNVARWLADDRATGQPILTDAEGRFRVEGIIPGLQFGLHLRKKNVFLIAEEKYRKMTLGEGIKELGDIVVKPFRPE